MTVVREIEVSAGDEPERLPSVDAVFGEWVAPHLAALWALAVHEVGSSAADDVVQESLLRAWRKWSTYDPLRGAARAWLVAIVLDRSRRDRVRRRPKPTARASAEVRDAATEVAVRVGVEQAVRRLPARQRQVVVLYYLADLALADVATLLKISQGAVKAQLFDARANLRQLLEDQDG